jgi:hypothetical protein
MRHGERLQEHGRSGGVEVLGQPGHDSGTAPAADPPSGERLPGERRNGRRHPLAGHLPECRLEAVEDRRGWLGWSPHPQQP